MDGFDRRVHPRFSRQFNVELSKKGLHVAVGGVTDNVGQGGAFIRTEGWNAFRINDQMIVTFYVPPTFSGHDATIALQGSAVVARIDTIAEGVAVRFDKYLKQFERIDHCSAFFFHPSENN